MALLCSGAISGYRGIALSVLGRWDDAEASFRDAIERNRRIHASLWAVHAECDLARVYARRGAPGDEARARALLDPVRTWAAPRGAKRLLRKVGEIEERLRGKSTATHTLPPSSPEPGILFRREGEFWAIGAGERTVRLRESKGLRYLEILLRHPSRPFRARELVALVHDDGEPRGTGGNGAGSEGAHPVLTLGDAGEVVDQRTAADLRRRAREIRDEIEEATRWSDIGRLERLRSELEFLDRELRASRSPAGRVRRGADVEDRIRKAVTKAIRDAIGRIRRENRELGHHLDLCIRTGSTCLYQAVEAKQWILRP